MLTVLNRLEAVTWRTFELLTAVAGVEFTKTAVVLKSVKVGGKVIFILPRGVVLSKVTMNVQLAITLIAAESRVSEVIVAAVKASVIRAAKTSSLVRSGIAINQIYYTVDCFKKIKLNGWEQVRPRVGQKHVILLDIFVGIVVCWFNSTFLQICSIYGNSSLIFTSGCIVFMHCSTNSVPILSAKVISNAKTTVSAACPASAKTNNVTTKKCAKRNQKAALNQQTAINPLQLANKALKPQTTDCQSVIEHSRSRDKSRRLPKSKGKKKQTKGKQPNPQIVNNPIPVIANQVLTSDLLPLQTQKLPIKEPVHEGNTATEGNNLVNPIVQKQVGKVTDNVSTIVASTPTNAKESPKIDLLPPNLPIQKFSQPVYQGWQLNVQQVVRQSKPTLEEPKIKKEKPQEDNRHRQSILFSQQLGKEDNKEKEIHQNLTPSEKLPNQRSQRRANHDRMRYKTKICYDFLNGKCKRPTNQCTYAHGYDDMKQQCKIKFICRNYNRGICKKPQAECKFYHQRLRDIDNYSFSENSNGSEEHRRREFKMDLALKNEGRRVENREERRPEQRQEKRQQRREQRIYQRAQEKRSQERKVDKVQDYKNSKRSVERDQVDILEKQQVRREENKRYVQSQQNVNIYDINSAYMNPYPYFTLNNGYCPQNNFPQQYNRPQEMVYGFQNNAQGGYPSYYAPPANYPPYYPMPQQNPVLLSQMPSSNYNPPSNPQFNTQNRTNMASLQHISAPMHPNYSMQNPNDLHQFYPWFPQYANNQGNDRLASSNPESIFNGNLQEKEKYVNRQPNRSRSRSRDRKEKRNHRR